MSTSSGRFIPHYKLISDPLLSIHGCRHSDSSADESAQASHQPPGPTLSHPQSQLLFPHISLSSTNSDESDHEPHQQDEYRGSETDFERLQNFCNGLNSSNLTQGLNHFKDYLTTIRAKDKHNPMVYAYDAIFEDPPDPSVRIGTPYASIRNGQDCFPWINELHMLLDILYCTIDFHMTRETMNAILSMLHFLQQIGVIIRDYYIPRTARELEIARQYRPQPPLRMYTSIFFLNTPFTACEFSQ